MDETLLVELPGALVSPAPKLGVRACIHRLKVDIPASRDATSELPLLLNLLLSVSEFSLSLLSSMLCLNRVPDPPSLLVL